MTTDPKVSVVMAVHNGQDFLEESMRSILNQTFRDFEFIIVDDGSTDRTAAIVKILKEKEPRIRFIRQQNKGQSAALNRAIGLARGKFIAQLDDDDISLPERLHWQVDYLERHPQTGMVGSWADMIDKEGRVISHIRHATTDRGIRRRMLWKNQFVFSSVMLRREAFEKAGPYEKKYPYSIDYDMFLRVMRDFEVANIPRVLLRYRFYFENYYGRKQKRQELDSLKLRVNALLSYGYPARQAAYLIKPILSFFVPISMKRAVLRRLWKPRAGP